jgi:hypothetical protein
MGFILGMVYTFGGILPIAAAAVVAAVSLLLHPVARFVVRKVKPVA